MGRHDDETETSYITVPSFFKCPISLDVMTSPVSLCTGVTYDRASIQRWLDGGNNTCPATMQLLKTQDLVPNLTLQRLIKLWSDSSGPGSSPILNPPSGTKVPTKEEVNESLNRLMTTLSRDDDVRIEILTRIVRFLKDSDTNREFLKKKKTEFITLLVGIIRMKTTTKKKMELVLMATKILDTIKPDRETLSNLMLNDDGGDCLTAMLLAIRRGDQDSKIEAVRVLDWISYDARSKLLVAEHDGVLTETIKLINVTDSDPSLIEASLSFLITISKSKRVGSKLIAAKVISKIKDILMTTEMTSVSVTEKSLKLLETLSSKREGRAEMCGEDNGRCVEGVVNKLLKVSTAATEHAVTILWCLCYVFREGTAAVERSNGVTKLLVVIQSNCSVMVRQMAKDLIKVLKINSSALSAYETKTTHIMPF
ncbi:PREDICTED: U-box domain-containing protein 29-like [Camelina sativa]|uniref:U-box domain-containing protein n=1 Tax=Camelina sativa TaxID=90675 RepID=A0ABM0YWV5_CAMSA|nr:PREDICTED: U-box domain-containing protein 29-like [Camelina sativa]